MSQSSLQERLSRLNKLAKKRTQGELEATPFGIRLKEYPHLTVASHFTGRSPMDDCRYFAAMPEALSIANELQAKLDAMTAEVTAREAINLAKAFAAHPDAAVYFPSAVHHEINTFLANRKKQAGLS